MKILMEPAKKFIPDIVAGKIERVGAMLVDSNTRQIVGHLKEAGDMGSVLSELSFSPLKLAQLANPMGLVSNTIGHVASNYQIRELKTLVEGLQLTTNIAAASSVIGMGISTVGFYMINKKLGGLEKKIDRMANKIDVLIKFQSEHNVDWNILKLARFLKAAEVLEDAEKASKKTRRNELTSEAVSIFRGFRQYYTLLLQQNGLFDSTDLDLNGLYEITTRYTLSCLGQLQAEFLRGDLQVYRSRLNSIKEEYANFSSFFDPQAIYLARSNKRHALDIGFSHEKESKLLVAFSDSIHENAARIDTHAVELDYLERNNLSVSEYRDMLVKHETDIVLLRH